MRHIVDNPMGEYARIAKDLENPAIKIDKLAQYAQGLNPAVPEFLALAEIKRRQNLVAHSPQPAPSTVREDLVKSAMPQAMQQPMGLPAMQRPQGVAALPTGMGEQSYAGGGIVAFAGDDGSDVRDPFAGLSFEEKMRLMQAQGESGDGIATKSSLFKRAMPDVGSFSKNLGALDPAQAARTFSRTQDQEDREGPAAVPPGMDPTKQIAPPSESKTSSKGTSGKAAAKDAIAALTETKPKEDMYSKYEKMLSDQAAEAKAGRQQDKYMRLLEAGLGIMGGTSPYALTNIGQGAMGAAKGYAQDRAAAAKEDRENIKELMGLGMKREEAEREAEKMAMTKELYGAHGRYYDAAAKAAGVKAAGAGVGANTRLTIAQEKNAVSLYNKWLAGNPMASQQERSAAWAEAQQMAGVQGGPAGGAPAQTTVSYSDFLSSLKK